jgi:hypothetical protein
VAGGRRGAPARARASWSGCRKILEAEILEEALAVARKKPKSVAVTPRLGVELEHRRADRLISIKAA